MGLARRRASSSSEGGKRNRHVVDLLFAGNRLTVARGHGQHQPAISAFGPNASSIPDTARSFRTAAERRKSHWSALSQPTRSHLASGDQATEPNSPAPLKSVCVPVLSA